VTHTRAMSTYSEGNHKRRNLRHGRDISQISPFPSTAPARRSKTDSAQDAEIHHLEGVKDKSRGTTHQLVYLGHRPVRIATRRRLYESKKIGKKNVEKYP